MAENTRASTDVDAAIGARIAAARQQAGLGNKQLASALGVSVQQLQKYETGFNRIPAGRLAAAAQALQCSSDALLGLPIAPAGRVTP